MQLSSQECDGIFTWPSKASRLQTLPIIPKLAGDDQSAPPVPIHTGDDSLPVPAAPRMSQGKTT